MTQKCYTRLWLNLWQKLLHTSLLLALTMSLPTNATEIDFTRYLGQYSDGAGEPVIHEASFFGVPGGARLVITSPDDQIKATIQLNGVEVVDGTGVLGAGHLEVPIRLVENNSLLVTLAGDNAGSISIRVKQLADIELHVLSRMHFNTNVSNFVAAREFYGKLGFQTLTGFPDTNTLEMARAIGITTPTTYDGSQGETAGGYLLHGELVGLSGYRGGLIDLIEFTIPRSEEAPYAHVNHLGMARAAMHTTNIAADYKTLTTAGVEFIAAPTARADGTLFAIFTDLDGTYYELIEVEGEDEDTETTHITRLAQVNINVSDFERSRAWYQMMGYEVSKQLPRTDSLTVARAMGFEEQFEVEGAMVTQQVDGSTLELVQWITPHNPERAYSIPVNHLGIHRMAYATSDIAADVATLEAQGVAFLSEITPCCSGPDSSGSIIAFYDPDGTIIELVQQPWLMTQMLSLLQWLSDNFF